MAKVRAALFFAVVVVAAGCGDDGQSVSTTPSPAGATGTLESPPLGLSERPRRAESVQLVAHGNGMLTVAFGGDIRTGVRAAWFDAGQREWAALPGVPFPDEQGVDGSRSPTVTLADAPAGPLALTTICEGEVNGEGDCVGGPHRVEAAQLDVGAREWRKLPSLTGARSALVGLHDVPLSAMPVGGGDRQLVVLGGAAAAREAWTLEVPSGTWNQEPPVPDDAGYLCRAGASEVVFAEPPVDGPGLTAETEMALDAPPQRPRAAYRLADGQWHPIADSTAADAGIADISASEDELLCLDEHAVALNASGAALFTSTGEEEAVHVERRDALAPLDKLDEIPTPVPFEGALVVGRPYLSDDSPSSQLLHVTEDEVRLVELPVTPHESAATIDGTMVLFRRDIESATPHWSSVDISAFLEG